MSYFPINSKSLLGFPGRQAGPVQLFNQSAAAKDCLVSQTGRQALPSLSAAARGCLAAQTGRQAGHGQPSSSGNSLPGSLQGSQTGRC